MTNLAQSLLTALLLSMATLISTAATTPATPMNPTVTTASYKVAVFPSPNPSKLNVYVEREPGKQMVIMLKDASGDVLGEQLIGKKQGSFHFQFDLSDLQDGTYKIEVVSGRDVTIHPVTLTTQPTQALTRVLTLN